MKIKNKFTIWVNKRLKEFSIFYDRVIHEESRRVRKIRRGNIPELSKAIEKIIPSTPFKEEPDYFNNFLMIDMPEGWDQEDMRIKHHTGLAVVGDINTDKKRPVRIYVKVVGLEDDNAPIRNWGVGLKEFKKHYRS